MEFIQWLEKVLRVTWVQKKEKEKVYKMPSISLLSIDYRSSTNN